MYKVTLSGHFNIWFKSTAIKKKEVIISIQQFQSLPFPYMIQTENKDPIQHHALSSEEMKVKLCFVVINCKRTYIIDMALSLDKMIGGILF